MEKAVFRPVASVAVFTATLLISGCSQAPPPIATTGSPTAAPSPILNRPSPVPTLPGDPFQRAVDRAASATTLAQAAQTQDDWRLVVSRWQQAIAFLKAVPPANVNYGKARQLLTQYQQSLSLAQQRSLQGSVSQPPSALQRSPSADGIPLVAGNSNEATETGPTVAENLNTLNQQQQSFFKAQQRFASNLTELGDPIPADTPSYTYNTIAVQPDQAMSTATAKQEGLPSYVGAVRVLNRSKPDAIVEIICRSSQPTRTPPALPQAVDQGLKCPTGSIKVQ